MDYSVDTFEQARELTRRNAKTFYFASHALPPEKRLASYALYSFCRYVDNIADTGGDARAARVQLDVTRNLLDHIYESDQQLHRWSAFQETVRRNEIPKRYFLDLVDGVEMDLTAFSCSTYADLQKYCYRVASVVGLMMTRVFQPDNDEALQYAEHLGTAMQLTNILRDIGEDYRMHRVYLPNDDMRDWGIGEEDLHKGEVTPAFRRFIQFQIARAREFYTKAKPGIALLPNDGSRYCVHVMSVLYSRILNAIEANEYDVFTRRAHVPLPEKIRLAASVALQGQARPYFPRISPGRRISGVKARSRDRLAQYLPPESDTRKECQPHE